MMHSFQMIYNTMGSFRGGLGHDNALQGEIMPVFKCQVQYIACREGHDNSGRMFEC